MSTKELMLLNGSAAKDSWVPWTARKSNKCILKEINPEYLLEGLMLKLKLQYFGHLMWRDDSVKKTLMLRKIEGKRKRGWQRMKWLDSITNSMDMNLSKLRHSGGLRSLVVYNPWGHKSSHWTPSYKIFLSQYFI